MKKGAGRKPDPYRQRLLKKSGITREEGRHMSIELLEQLVRCKSPEARRVIVKASRATTEKRFADAHAKI